jgi:hypothetical protein
VEQRHQRLRTLVPIARIILKGAASFAALFLFLSVACGSQLPAAGGAGTSPSPPTVATSCQDAHFPFPPPAANLSAADSGRTINVHVGDLVAVTLLGKDAPGGRWGELSVQGDALLALPNPANTATVGTQLGEYCAAGAGSSTIASGAWHATVEVR